MSFANTPETGGSGHDRGPLTGSCLVCGTSLDGPDGLLLHWFGVRRSNRNPNVCNRCNSHIEEGKLVEVSVLFVDLCSFTSLTSDLGPEQTHAVVDSFLSESTRVVLDHDGSVDKYIGDALMAVFNVPIRRGDHAARAVASAQGILALMSGLSSRHRRELQVRVGVATGAVRVGSLGSRDSRDVTVLGEAVNRAARLMATARPGEVVIDLNVYQQVAADYPGAVPEAMQLKGFSKPTLGYRLVAGAAVSGLKAEPARARGKHGWAALRSLLVALLSAPCLIGAALNPAATLLALGSLGSSTAQALTPGSGLDHWAVRLPLGLFALASGGINLYMVWNARRVRQGLASRDVAFGLSQKEKARERWVLALSGASITVVILEALAHRYIRNHTHF